MDAWSDTCFNELILIDKPLLSGLLSWDEARQKWVISSLHDYKSMKPKLPNEMKWDPMTLTWKGNEVALDTFDFE